MGQSLSVYFVYTEPRPGGSQFVLEIGIDPSPGDLLPPKPNIAQGVGPFAFGVLYFPTPGVIPRPFDPNTPIKPDKQNMSPPGKPMQKK